MRAPARLASAVLLGGACSWHGGAAPRPATAAAGPVAAAAPVPADPAWMLDLQRELTALRGLPFTRHVPFGTQTKSDFRLKVRGELARDLPAGKAADLSRSYGALGFAERGFDLSKALEDALTSEVVAYYDPETRDFRLIGDGPAATAAAPEHAAVVSHELVHALQDQHFDLQRFAADRDPVVDEDQKLARRFVTEGEATFLMMTHGLGNGSPQQRQLGAWSVAGLRVWTRMLASMDVLEVASNVRAGHGSDTLDDQARAELTAVAKLPPVVTVPLFEPYFKGAELISDVWASGGWAAVDALYRHPPESTEQVLHPAEKLIARRDRPVRIGLAASAWPPAPARALPSEVIGELGWRIYFKTWKLPDADQAAAGWGGDRYWSWAVGDRTVTITATTWDTARDADEFLDAYEATLAARFPLAVPTTLAGGGLRLDVPGGTLVAIVHTTGATDVDILQGLQSSELGAARAVLKNVTRLRPVEEGAR